MLLDVVNKSLPTIALKNNTCMFIKCPVSACWKQCKCNITLIISYMPTSLCKVNRGRISLVRLVQVLCENPARISGLYLQKGTIAVGSDADIVIFDPSREFTLQTHI